MKINYKQKILIRVYIVIFAVIFIMMGWDNISLALNYKEIFGLNDNTLNNQVIKETQGTLPNVEIIKLENNSNKVNRGNSIEISKIGITAPIIMGESADLTVLEKNLDEGVVVFPDSVLPGQSGQTVILGHSAPALWPHIKYDWVFSDLNDLNIHDEIKITFDNKDYIYRVIKKDIIDKGGDIDQSALNGKNNILVLISCWPPGKNHKRIAVQSELIRIIE